MDDHGITDDEVKAQRIHRRQLMLTFIARSYERDHIGLATVESDHVGLLKQQGVFCDYQSYRDPLVALIDQHAPTRGKEIIRMGPRAYELHGPDIWSIVYERAFSMDYYWNTRVSSREDTSPNWDKVCDGIGQAIRGSVMDRRRFSPGDDKHALLKKLNITPHRRHKEHSFTQVAPSPARYVSCAKHHKSRHDQHTHSRYPGR